MILDKRGGPISGQPSWSGNCAVKRTGTLTLRQLAIDPQLSRSGITKALNASARLLAKLGDQHLKQRRSGAELASHSVITNCELNAGQAPEAVDLSEAQQTLGMYGVGRSRRLEYGRNCLVARRLVERGVQFVKALLGRRSSRNSRDFAQRALRRITGASRHARSRPAHRRTAGRSRRTRPARFNAGRLGGEVRSDAVGEGRTLLAANHNPYGYSMWMAGLASRRDEYGGTKRFPALRRSATASTTTTSTRRFCTSWASTTNALTGSTGKAAESHRRRRPGRQNILA